MMNVADIAETMRRIANALEKIAAKGEESAQLERERNERRTLEAQLSAYKMEADRRRLKAAGPVECTHPDPALDFAGEDMMPVEDGNAEGVES